MALFKILKGLKANLDNQPKKEGYAWYTTDDSKLYIDVSDSERQPLNSYYADKLKGNSSLPAIPTVPVAKDEEIPYSWEEINAIALSGHATDWISVGAIKSVTLSEEVLGTTTHDVRVIGINQDNDQSITFQTKNCLVDATEFGSSNTIWIGSIARSLCQNYYNAFFGKNYIKTVSKGTCTDANDSRTGTAIYNDETVWLPSEREMGLDSYSPLSAANSTISNAECTKGKNFFYTYYTSSSNRIKKLGDSGSTNYCWERSRYYGSGNTSNVCGIDFLGRAINTSYRDIYGLAPAFVIGNEEALTGTAPDLSAEDIITRFDNISTIKEINAGLDQKFWRGTKAEYNAIEKKDDSVMYIVTDDNGESGADGGDVFVVTIENGSSFASHTSSEIVDAHERGKMVILTDNHSGFSNNHYTMYFTSYRGGGATIDKASKPKFANFIGLYNPVNASSGNTTGESTIRYAAIDEDGACYIYDMEIPLPSDYAPLVAGTASAGTSDEYSRSDHVHPAEVGDEDRTRWNTALLTTGGTMTGNLVLNSSLILNSTQYGTTYPSNPQVGQLFFWKAT